ncbi:hypothetical protein FQR65_LT08683 [Abscondita terminalis]|nr:hypothetical protein FQR65_LT08683 [Abscondita terminalis]
MRKTLNASACAALLEEVNWSDPGLLTQLSILALINVMVIVGNCLVIAAVFCSSKLRSVTNLFIVSLAVADLLVGVAVLPFSATWEIFKVWIFGDTWCSVWLALDVWMCTASILNLCAISLDRYVAVTRPITYPSIMSHSRAKLLIAGLWVLSFVICFPPLVGWKDKKNEDDVTNSTLPEDPPCPWKCELTNEAGYVVYSALGSFYIPMFVMLFFYWRIYRAAVRTTRAINQGFRTTKGTKGLGNRFDEQRLTLRIHRGRGSSTKHLHGSPHSTGSNSTTTTTGSASPSPRGKHERVKISVSYPSTENVSSHSTPHLLTVSPTSPLGQATYAVHYTANGKEVTSTSLYRKDNHLRVQNRLGSQDKKPPRRLSFDGHIERIRDPSPSPSVFEDGVHKPKVMSKRMGKRNIKAQVKRFRMETKAAKTLGIIVGGFIFCWLPFFTMYLIRAFCERCIHPLLFSVLFWLGYCNSAINPLIYALFSKDFRFAFKRIICKCFCTGASQSSDAVPMDLNLLADISVLPVTTPPTTEILWGKKAIPGAILLIPGDGPRKNVLLLRCTWTTIHPLK